MTMEVLCVCECRYILWKEQRNRDRVTFRGKSKGLVFIPEVSKSEGMSQPVIHEMTEGRIVKSIYKGKS